MKKTFCRICKGRDLYCFLDLGFHPHSDWFRRSLDIPCKYYPLRLVRCRSCGLVQLDYVVEPEALYQEDYLYQSSITKTGDVHWSEFAQTVAKKAGLMPGDAVIDIGSNDGTLLGKFKNLGMDVCGIDPCREIADIAVARGIPCVNDYFGESAMREAQKKVGNIKLITGTNVFAHIDDLDAVLGVVAAHLHEDGLFVFESPYFGDFYDGLQYDTVYHQHLSYLSLKPLIPFFERFGLMIIDLERRPIHGGSFRVYAGRNGRPSPAVAETVSAESWTDADMDAFARRTEQNRDALFDLVYSLAKSGKSVAAVSSPAKGQTLLNYTGIGRFLEFSTDKSRLKQGRYTPGSNLMIHADDELIRRQPDYAILLAWNFADEIIANNAEYKGKWIIPIPFPKIV